MGRTRQSGGDLRHRQIAGNPTRMRLTPGDKGFVLESKAFDCIGEQLGRVEWGAIALSRQALSDRLIIEPLVVEV